LLWVPRLSLAIALHPLFWRVKHSLVQYTSSAVGTLLSNLVPDSASMGLDPLCHKEEYAAPSQGVHTGTAEDDLRDDRTSDALNLQSRPEVSSKSSYETILAHLVGELQRSCTANQSGRVEVAKGREDHRSAAPAGPSVISMEDSKDMDSAAMQLQMLFMAKQMAMMTREPEQMKTKTSPDNKRTKSEVGSGNSGQLEGMTIG
jgi:Tfp pilus assembly protein FimT